MPARIDRENPNSPDAISLIAELDVHLSAIYPAASRHGFSVEKLLADDIAFFVLRSDNAPAACGGIKLFPNEFAELKRMFVRPAFRGRGFGKLMLEHLANFARSQNIFLLRLETGIHQREAISLYERAGFAKIPPFAPYTDDPLSRCYEKRID